MPLLQSDLLSVLHRYVPAEFAANMVERAFARCGIEGTTVPEDDLDRLLDAVQIGIHLFVEPAQQRAIKADLERVTGVGPAAYEARETIASPSDVFTARAEARRVALRLGARSLIAQRVSSVISELGQNVLLHARNGSLEIRGQRSEPRVIVVIAQDEGPGIADLQSVLRATRGPGYGLGLAGIKKTVDRFQIQSTPRGTRVEAHVFV